MSNGVKLLMKCVAPWWIVMKQNRPIMCELRRMICSVGEFRLCLMQITQFSLRSSVVTFAESNLKYYWQYIDLFLCFLIRHVQTSNNFHSSSGITLCSALTNWESNTCRWITDSLCVCHFPQKKSINSIEHQIYEQLKCTCDHIFMDPLERAGTMKKQIIGSRFSCARNKLISYFTWHQLKGIQLMVSCANFSTLLLTKLSVSMVECFQSFAWQLESHKFQTNTEFPVSTLRRMYNFCLFRLCGSCENPLQILSETFPRLPDYVLFHWVLDGKIKAFPHPSTFQALNIDFNYHTISIIFWNSRKCLQIKPALTRLSFTYQLHEILLFYLSKRERISSRRCPKFGVQTVSSQLA